MAFHSYNTKTTEIAAKSKSLVYGIHGSGKTKQAEFFAKTYGKGFIISGEAGLRSIAGQDISYLPFTSWEDGHDPANGKFSFVGICSLINSPDFKAEKFKWIMLDSLTELSDRLYEHLLAHPETWVAKSGKQNPLEMWVKYSEKMMAALKWIRDLDYTVVVSALAKEERDDQERVTYWPMVKGAGVGRQLPGIFDNVFGLTKTTDTSDKDNPKIQRWVVCDEVYGWKAKVRTPTAGLVKPVEQTGDITQILERLSAVKSS